MCSFTIHRFQVAVFHQLYSTHSGCSMDTFSLLVGWHCWGLLNKDTEQIPEKVPELQELRIQKGLFSGYISSPVKPTLFGLDRAKPKGIFISAEVPSAPFTQRGRCRKGEEGGRQQNLELKQLKGWNVKVAVWEIGREEEGRHCRVE